MSLPPGVTTRTYTGSIVGLDGVAATGTLEFRQPKPIYDAANNVVVGPQKPITATVTAGAFSVQLPVSPWQYVVRIATDAIKDVYLLLVEALPTGPLHFADTYLTAAPAELVDFYVLRATFDALAARVADLEETGGVSVPDATSTTKGLIRLTGDLAGTAAAPTVPGLAGKYTKPGSGIPASDLTAAVQALLTLAGTAVQPGTLAAVATTGTYASLTGKPTIPDSPDDIGAAPAAHQHTASDVTDLTTAVDSRIALVIDAAPESLNTLNELAAALGDDPNFAGTVTTLIGTKQPLSAVLTQLAAITAADNDVIQRKAGTLTNRTPAQVKTDLALTKSDVGLSNVDNTSDTNKPISSATQTALNGKLNLTLIDAAGDLIVGSGNDTAARLAKGTDDQLLAVVGGSLTWVDPPEGGGAGLQTDPVAARYGCLALTLNPHAISWTTPQYLALTSGRHYMYWVPLPAGTLVTGVRLPVQLAGSGAGELRFAVYNDDNSQLGTTGDVAAQFAGAVGETWQNAPLTAAAATTGNGVWITALSTMDTGPMVVFSNTSNLPEWLLNPASHLTALRREGVATPPTTLVPSTAIPYIDFAIGVY